MSQQRIVIDRIACDGAGVCAHLAPSVISLDPWGYPIIGETIDVDQARRAVRGCPQRALHLLDDAPKVGGSVRADQSSSSS